MTYKKSANSYKSKAVALISVYKEKALAFICVVQKLPHIELSTKNISSAHVVYRHELLFSICACGCGKPLN